MSLYHRSKPDILVLDVMMPQMDGFTLAKMIRQTDTQTPILFLTARSSVDDLITGFHLGGNDYLKKPFDMEELIVRILALLNRPIIIEEEKRPEVFSIGQYTFDYPRQTLQISTKQKHYRIGKPRFYACFANIRMMYCTVNRFYWSYGETIPFSMPAAWMFLSPSYVKN